jgi:Ser/Thr protein kinase RdoA (MazF antagonist)
MSEAIIRRILKASGIVPVRISGPQKGYRNQSWPVEVADGRILNVILYKAEPGILGRIRAANSVSDFLAAGQLPARQTIGRVIRLSAGNFERYAAIYTYLPGRTIAWEAYTMRHIKALGAGLSEMHAALQHYDQPLPSVAAEYIAITKRMDRYFARTDVREAMQAKLGFTTNIPRGLMRVLAHADQLPGQQALHMDFVRGNILFEDYTISGILDLEKAARGHRAFDVARTLAFLLVDCKYKQEEKVRKYFLASGYNKRGPLSFHDITIRFDDASMSLLESLADIFLLYDLYKFLRHNPYEHLHQNEHFVRTRDILASRQVIAYNKLKERVTGKGRHGNILEKEADFAE